MGWSLLTAAADARTVVHRNVWWRWGTVQLVILLALFVQYTSDENEIVVPAILLFGASLGPVVFALFVLGRLRRPDPVPAGTIAGMALYGGAVGVLFGGALDALLVPTEASWPTLLVGPIEELTKFVAPLALVLVTGARYRAPTAGLVLGLAVAGGCAVLEAMGYGYSAVVGSADVQAVLLTPLGRSMLVPFSHMAWTGTLCVVAWTEWNRVGKVTITWRIAGAFVLVSALHSLNDLAATYDATEPIWLAALVATMIVSLGVFLVVARPLVDEHLGSPAPS